MNVIQRTVANKIDREDAAKESVENYLLPNENMMGYERLRYPFF